VTPFGITELRHSEERMLIAASQIAGDRQAAFPVLVPVREGMTQTNSLRSKASVGFIT